MTGEKIIIYQLFPRLFANTKKFLKTWGTVSENGCGKLSDIGETALRSIREMGITHIWLTGIINHSTATDYSSIGHPASHPQIIKGLAGSPYAIRDYYDIDPDLSINIKERLKEFRDLLVRIHNNDMKVIIDFVPNHLSRDYHSVLKPEGTPDFGENDDPSVFFSPDNNFYYLPGHPLKLPSEPGAAGPFSEIPAKATGNDVFSANPSINDWYETVKLNYGINPETGEKHFTPIPDTWIRMYEILKYWSSMGVDGFRCDMAGMVPVEFWSYVAERIKEDYPNIILIAELYESSKYEEYILKGGFDYLYDKVGLYDTLRSIIAGNKSSSDLSKVWQKLGGLDKYMLRFLENHDEQRIASVFFAGDPWKGIPGMAVCSMLNSGPVMIYNGQEVGEKAPGPTGFSGDDGRTSIFDYCSMPEMQKWFNNGYCDGVLLDPDQKSLRKAYSDILNFCRSNNEFTGGFYDLMWQNQDLNDEIKNRIYAFLRYDNNSCLLITISFKPKEINKLNIRIPGHALKLTPAGIKERYSVKMLYPDAGEATLMLSQLTGRGIEIHFNRTGWAAIRIE